VRGLYFEGWHLAGRPTKERTRADFFRPFAARAAQGLGGIDPDLAGRAIFGVMWEKLEVGEIGKVIDRLPADLQELRR
jgi:uncharacterized protein (DUF2267 family)